MPKGHVPDQSDIWNTYKKPVLSAIGGCDRVIGFSKAVPHQQLYNFCKVLSDSASIVVPDMHSKFQFSRAIRSRSDNYVAHMFLGNEFLPRAHLRF